MIHKMQQLENSVLLVSGSLLVFSSAFKSLISTILTSSNPAGAATGWRSYTVLSRGLLCWSGPKLTFCGILLLYMNYQQFTRAKWSSSASPQKPTLGFKPLHSEMLISLPRIYPLPDALRIEKLRTSKKLFLALALFILRPCSISLTLCAFCLIKSTAWELKLLSEYKLQLFQKPLHFSWARVRTVYISR